MSGETEREPSGWSVDQLKQHYDSMLREMDKRYTERFVSQEKAIDKKTTEIEARFQSVNEFRQVLTDQSATFITRTEAMSAIRALDDKLDLQERRGERGSGHAAGLNAAWGYLLGAAGFAVAVVAVILAAR